MNAMSIRRIDPEIREWLRQQAARHGVSMEEEVRAILRRSREAAEAERRREEQARWEDLFAKAVTLPPGSPNSTDIIRRMRDER